MSDVHEKAKEALLMSQNVSALLQEIVLMTIPDLAKYVSVNGNDINDGSFSKPWRTIQKAADSVQPGDVVRIMAGTYKENVVLKTSGTVDAFIIFESYENDEVVIDGTGIALYDARKALFDTNGKSFIIIDGLRIVNADYFGIGDMAGETVNGHDIVVRNCYTLNTGSSGIAFFFGANITISDNTVERSNLRSTQEAISLHGIQGFTINGNEVFDGLMEGIDAKGGSSNGKIFDNHVHDLLAGEWDMNGIYLDAYDRHEHDIEVFDNIVENCGNGIIVGAEAGGHAEFINIHDNTIRHCRAGFNISGWGSTSDVHNINDIIFEHNYVSETADNGITFSNAGARNIRLIDNVLGGRLSGTDPIEMTNGVIAVDPSVVIDRNALNKVGTKASNLNGTNYTLLTPPAIPQNVRVTYVGGKVTVLWDEPEGANLYEVLRCASTLSTGYYKNLGTAPDGAFVDSGLAAGTYWYKIIANNGLASSDPSVPVKIKI